MTPMLNPTQRIGVPIVSSNVLLQGGRRGAGSGTGTGTMIPPAGRFGKHEGTTGLSLTKARDDRIRPSMRKYRKRRFGLTGSEG